MIKLDEMINKFSEYGLKILEYNKVMAHCPVKCCNADGYCASVTYSTLRGTPPYIFSEFDKRNPYVLENINKYIKDNAIDITLLSFEFNGGSSPLTWKCSCGKVFECSLDSIRYSGKYLCNTCSFKKRAMSNTFEKEDVIKQINKFGMSLVGEYNGSLIPITVKDNDGYIGDITLANIKSNKRFSIFSPKYIYDNLKNYIKTKGYNLEIIYVYPFLNRRERPKIKCRCECGNVFEMGMESLLGFKKYRCDECTNKMSRYESLVKKELDRLFVVYCCQKRFYEYNFQKYPFDFYLNDYNIIIEVDGEGHFFPVRFNGISEEESIENFKQCRIRDELKNKFCHTNNIEIIRIPYIKILNNEYVEIISNLTCGN